MPESDPEKRQALAQVRTLHPAPDRVHAALFLKHPDFFDACDELQVKYEMLRAHFLDGRPVTTVCAAFGYSRQTFYLLRDRLAHRGLTGLRDARPGPVGPRTCTPAVVAFLRAPSRRCRSRPCWTASNARTGSVCIGGPWSESCALVHEKKTPRSGEPAAGACSCLAPGRFPRGWRSGPGRIRAAAVRFSRLGQPRRSGAPGRARPRGPGRAPHAPGGRVAGALCGRAPIALDRDGGYADDRVG